VVSGIRTAAANSTLITRAGAVVPAPSLPRCNFPVKVVDVGSAAPTPVSAFAFTSVFVGCHVQQAGHDHVGERPTTV
jgi:hypothetical protein